MKVIILTTSVYGTTGHHLPALYAASGIEVAMVVVSEGLVSNRKKQYLKRIKKILKIGLRGALNGVKMRKWYNEDIKKYTTIENAEEFCKRHHIPFKRVPSTNSDDTVSLFQEANADVGLSLGHGYISKKVFSIPKYGMLNIHHEVLPEYQNAQSIIWQLYNGSAETGYTIHKIDRHIDTGEVLLQEKIPIVFKGTLEDTVAYNYARLFDASVVGLIKVLQNFQQFFSNAKRQGKGTSYTTPSYSQFSKMEAQFKKLKKQHKDQ